MTLSIDVDKLHLRYGDVTALDDLSFRLDGGKIYGLLGRNGAGKSSLLAVLAAFRQATAGEARIDGQPIFENPP
jgi:ABC-2 type transport system ATP-binding protein